MGLVNSGIGQIWSGEDHGMWKKNRVMHEKLQVLAFFFFTPFHPDCGHLTSHLFPQQ